MKSFHLDCQIILITSVLGFAAQLLEQVLKSVGSRSFTTYGWNIGRVRGRMSDRPRGLVLPRGFGSAAGTERVVCDVSSDWLLMTYL